MKVMSRAVDWCLKNPKIFWTVVMIGGLGDLAYLIWYLPESGVWRAEDAAKVSERLGLA